MKRVRAEVWGAVGSIHSGEDPYVYCLARDCARDEVVRKSPLELVMLDKALSGKLRRKATSCTVRQGRG